jgi:hypothetical protein
LGVQVTDEIHVGSGDNVGGAAVNLVSKLQVFTPEMGLKMFHSGTRLKSVAIYGIFTASNSK